MKLSNFIFVLVSMFAGVSTAQAYGYDDGPDYVIQEPQTAVVAHDYLYDYYNSRWVRVNSYVDYMSCWSASNLVFELKSSGFRVSTDGYWECPDQVEYSVFHDSFYVVGFNYHNHWASHHYSFHHYGVKVYFHFNVRHNKYHHYIGHSLYYGAKSRWSAGVKMKYRKWNRSHRRGVPVYHKSRNKVTYKKHPRKKSFKGKKRGFTRSGNKGKWKSGPKNHRNRGMHRGNGKRKGKSFGASNPRRSNSRGHVKPNRGNRGSKKGGKFKNRGSKRGGKYANRGSHRGHKAKRT